MIKKIILCLMVGIFCFTLPTDAQEAKKKPWLVVYSSQTGNTQKIAEAIFAVLPEGSEIYHIDQAPSADGYENIVVGFWTIRGGADDKAVEYLKKMTNSRVFLFGTMFSNDITGYGQGVLGRAAAVLNENCTVIGKFICQGKLSDEHVEKMKQRPAGHAHAPTPERMQKVLDASTHPDEQDCLNAQAAIKAVL